jgi:RNA polymerase sigma-70 factor, ECF subfamily
MSASPRPEEVSPDEADATLGKLLYANPAKPVVSEAEWVALVHAIAAHDPSALQGLYQRSHRLVYTLALRITGSPESADELTVDTFHEVWRRATTYDAQVGTVLAWIMNLARSRAIDRVRFDQRKKRVDPFPSTGPAISLAPEGPELQELAELGRRLGAALAQLTRLERQSVEAAYFGEMTYAEVAKHLRQPLGTIKTRIRSALSKLRDVLDSGSSAP